MKKFGMVPLAAVVALGACNEIPTALTPDGPRFELVDAEQRLATADVNAHVYGSFALQFTEIVGTPGGWGAILSGPANFPGNPKNAGTCDNGLWINSQGKRTSGSLDKPHPHCVGETAGTEEEVITQVVLEPISARNRQIGANNENLQLAADRPEGDVRLQGGGAADSEGRGTIVAYAIDAATLDDVAPRRVGTLTIDLTQYTSNDTNYFLEDCSLDVDRAYVRCLNKVISASYEPLAGADGVGTARSVTGFLYWSPAAAPFNYGSN